MDRKWPKSKDKWDKAAIIISFGGAVLLPAAIAVATFWFHKKEIELKQMELALTVLEQPGQYSYDIVSWASKVFRDGPIPLSEEAKNAFDETWRLNKNTPSYIISKNKGIHYNICYLLGDGDEILIDNSSAQNDVKILKKGSCKRLKIDSGQILSIELVSDNSYAVGTVVEDK